MQSIRINIDAVADHADVDAEQWKGLSTYASVLMLTQLLSDANTDA